MSNVKTVISGVVDIQNKTISKLRFNNNAIISLSGAMRSLSGVLDTIDDNYYNKSQTVDKIDEMIGIVTGQMDPDYYLSAYYTKEETDTQLLDYVEKSDVRDLIATKSRN